MYQNCVANYYFLLLLYFIACRIWKAVSSKSCLSPRLTLCHRDAVNLSKSFRVNINVTTNSVFFVECVQLCLDLQNFGALTELLYLLSGAHGVENVQRHLK